MLVGVAYSGWHEDDQNSAHDMDEAFRDLRRGDTAALSQNIADKKRLNETKRLNQSAESHF